MNATSSSRRQFLRDSLMAGTGLALAGLGLAHAGVAGQSAAPNLLFVFTDQQRLHGLGFWNAPGFPLDTVGDPVLTPNLDRLARESLVLTHAISSYPVCSPARACLLTGQFGFRNGVHWNCSSSTAGWDNQLRQDAVCWSDSLKQRGYSLGYIGKWHLDAPHAISASTSPW